MKEWGWRLNQEGIWSMEASEYIRRFRKGQGSERTERLSSLLDSPLHLPHQFVDALDEAHKASLKEQVKL